MAEIYAGLGALSRAEAEDQKCDGTRSDSTAPQAPQALPPIADEVAAWFDGGGRTSPHTEAALAYASRGWPVFPVRQNKHPLTPHGLTDATTDTAAIRAWWRRWPNASSAIATGEPSGIVALDIDLSDTVSGFDSLDVLGIAIHPVTPTAHTPRGGGHLLFRHPGRFVKTIAGKLGPGLDIRGDGGSLILPPGPGRYWDPHLGPDTPLAPMPAWMVGAEPATSKPVSRPASAIRLSRYGEAALDGAVRAIVSAPAGQQHETLNRECFTIGGLVAGGLIPAGLALESLGWAARQMASHEHHRPWRAADLDRLVRNSFLDGQLHPRTVAA